MIRIHLKKPRSRRQSPGAQRARLVRVSELSQSARTRAETHAPNTLSARTNKAFKVIVSCLMSGDRP